MFKVAFRFGDKWSELRLDTKDRAEADRLPDRTAGGLPESACRERRRQSVYRPAVRDVLRREREPALLGHLVGGVELHLKDDVRRGRPTPIADSIDS